MVKGLICVPTFGLCFISLYYPVSFNGKRLNEVVLAHPPLREGGGGGRLW